MIVLLHHPRQFIFYQRYEKKCQEGTLLLKCCNTITKHFLIALNNPKHRFSPSKFFVFFLLIFYMFIHSSFHNLYVAYPSLLYVAYRSSPLYVAYPSPLYVAYRRRPLYVAYPIAGELTIFYSLSKFLFLKNFFLFPNFFFHFFFHIFGFENSVFRSPVWKLFQLYFVSDFRISLVYVFIVQGAVSLTVTAKSSFERHQNFNDVWRHRHHHQSLSMAIFVNVIGIYCHRHHHISSFFPSFWPYDVWNVYKSPKLRAF